MALVDYLSSEEDSDSDTKSGTVKPQIQPAEKAPKSLKRKADDGLALPPLPAKFHDLYAINVRTSTRDDPSLHGGRKRVTPHVKGNWPTHVFIEWLPSTTQYACLKDVIDIVRNASPGIDIHTFLVSDLGAPLPLHVSLSAPIGFETSQKETFLRDLQEKLTKSGIKPFDASFTSLHWVANATRTRWFLVLRVARPEGDELNRLLALCNGVVKAYGQPALYSRSPSPSRDGDDIPSRKQVITQNFQSEPADRSDAFHISIGWSLAPPHEDESHFNSIGESTTFATIKEMRLRITEIKVKIGNEITSTALLSIPAS